MASTSEKLFLVGAALTVVALWAHFGTFTGILSLGLFFMAIGLVTEQVKNEAEIEKAEAEFEEKLRKSTEDNQ